MTTIQWKPEAGRKPTKKLLQEASNLARQDTADHIVVAMAMRPNGVTQHEVMALFGKPHRNKIRQLLESKKVIRYILPEGTRSTRIKLIKR